MPPRSGGRCAGWRSIRTRTAAGVRIFAPTSTRPGTAAASRPPRRPPGRCSPCWRPASQTAAVDRGVRYLVETQREDGGWARSCSPAPASPATSTSTTRCTGCSSDQRPRTICSKDNAMSARARARRRHGGPRRRSGADLRVHPSVSEWWRAIRERRDEHMSGLVVLRALRTEYAALKGRAPRSHDDIAGCKRRVEATGLRPRRGRPGRAARGGSHRRTRSDPSTTLDGRAGHASLQRRVLGAQGRNNPQGRSYAHPAVRGSRAPLADARVDTQIRTAPSSRPRGGGGALRASAHRVCPCYISSEGADRKSSRYIS